MKSLVLYPYPMELDGVSIQGAMLHRGLVENGVESLECDREADFEKEWVYKSFKPDVSIGIGYWGDTPTIIENPMHHGVTPVPWLNADGWVANYHDVLNDLPLIMVTSHWVKHTYNRDGVSNKNLEVMPIGIDMDEMSPLPKDHQSVQQIRKMLRIKPEQKMILTIGGDTTSKGFQEVLHALGKIDKEFGDWVYVGKSWECRSPYYHYKEELKIMRDLGIRRKVRFLDGPMSRNIMRALLSACDIYAAPSRIDGFGMIQVEAQACGTPVLGIDSMGIKDTVIHNKTGLLAKVGEETKLTEEWAYRWHGFKKKHKIKFDEPKTFAVKADVDDLSKHLHKMLTEDEFRAKLGTQAREHVVKNFEYRHVAKQVENLIQKKLHL